MNSISKVNSVLLYSHCLEFEEAMTYVQGKKSGDALNLLGLSTNQLILLFIGLVIILLLLFTFIFLGISAFALGGTFGSIINSLMPMSKLPRFLYLTKIGAGAALGKKKPIDMRQKEWVAKIEKVVEEVTSIIGKNE
jgi:hypothetical protein